LGHFCGHFPSKPDGFFHTPRPHDAIIHRIHPGQGAKIVSLPSISPSQTTFWDILPQKTGGKKEGALPFAASFAAVIICRRRNQHLPLGKSAKTAINYCNSS
jgi:hypothetical protein